MSDPLSGFFRSLALIRASFGVLISDRELLVLRSSRRSPA